MRLLDKLAFDEKKDQLWCVGDLVNRGPKSLEVLEFCMGLGDAFTCSLGNHDLHLLAVAVGGCTIRRQDTFDDVLTSPNRDEILNWLRYQKLLHYDEHRNLAMVHAGIPPNWSIKKARKLAAEIEAVIRDDNLTGLYCHNMYGNSPDSWSSDLGSPLRWRVITNYLTRMRFCTEKGRLDLKTKTGLDKTPKGYMPWFEVPGRKAVDTRIIFGHWAALAGATGIENVHALDTGCVWGHRLTAIDIDKPDKTHSVEAEK